MPDPSSPLQPIDVSPGPVWNPDAEKVPDYFIQPSAGEVFSAAASQAISAGPTETLGRMIQRSGDAGAPTLNGADATQKYGVAGPSPELSLSWNPSDQVNEAVAQQQSDLMRQRISNQWITANRPSTWGGAVASLGGDLVGTAVDPANIAASFVPVSWLGRGAELGLEAVRLSDAAAQAATLTRAVESSVASRIGAAAVQNAAGVALTQPILLAGAQQDHTDYTFGTAASNILFGGLLGAGLHGAGELLTGDIARGMMRAGGKSVDDGNGMAPQLAQDFVNASRPQVMQDLQEQLGRAPTDEEITAEMGARQDAISQKAQDGKYQPDVPNVGDVEPETGSDVEAVNAKVNQALQQDDYAGAADALKQHTDALESNPDLNLSAEDKQAANQPVQDFETTKNLMGDFVDCVTSSSEL